MQILIENGVVVAAASVGSYAGSVELVGGLPDDFKPGKYLWYTASVDYDENGEPIDPTECHIVKKIPKKVTKTDEEGNEYVEEIVETAIEYGEFKFNHNYCPVNSPSVTDEQRITAMEDAIAEIIDMLIGGEE